MSNPDFPSMSNPQFYPGQLGVRMVVDYCDDSFNNILETSNKHHCIEQSWVKDQRTRFDKIIEDLKLPQTDDPSSGPLFKVVFEQCNLVHGVIEDCKSKLCHKLKKPCSLLTRKTVIQKAKEPEKWDATFGEKLDVEDQITAFRKRADSFLEERRSKEST